MGQTGINQDALFALALAAALLLPPALLGLARLARAAMPLLRSGRAPGPLERIARARLWANLCLVGGASSLLCLLNLLLLGALPLAGFWAAALPGALLLSLMAFGWGLWRAQTPPVDSFELDELSERELLRLCAPAAQAAKEARALGQATAAQDPLPEEASQGPRL